MSEGVIIRVGLDGTRVTQSLKALKNTIAASTSQMKAEMQIFKNAGDQLSVLGAKFNGLERTIMAQDTQIKKLVESYNKAKEKFGENSEQAMKYANQINNATAKQAALKAQLQETQIAMNDFNRGTNKMRSSLSLATKETNALVARLTAEGKALRANKVEYVGLGTQIQERNRLIASERAKLQELIAAKGLDSEATRNQRIAVLELEAAQAGAMANYTRLGRMVGNSSNLSLVMRENMNKLKTSLSSAGNALTNAGHSMTMATLGLGAAFVYGSKEAIEFQKKMTDIRSLMVSDGEATKDATSITKGMTSQAKKLSQEYGVSMQAIGDAYEMMIRKGDTGEQAMAAVEKMIKASTAASSDFQETTKVSMNVMEQFFDKTKSSKATAENTTRVTNAMAYAADHGSAKFLELGYSMNYVGDYAKSVGYSMEDMSAYLEVMSRRGVEGTSAGTGLRGVIASLLKPAKAAGNLMDYLGIKTKDSNGNLLRLSNVIQQLRDKTKGMGTEEKGSIISHLFGRTSLPTVTALMTQSNKELDEFSAKIKKAESTDYAGVVTKRMMVSSQKQLARFKETLKNFDMEISATMLPTITSFVEKLNSLLKKFDELSPRTKKIIGGIALGTAVFAPLAIVIGSVFKAISITISGVTLLGRGFGTLFTMGARVGSRFDRMSLALRGYRREVNQTTIANEELALSERATTTAGGPTIGSRVSRNSRGLRNAESAVEEEASIGSRVARNGRTIRTIETGAQELAGSAGSLSRGARFLGAAGKVGKVVGGGIIGLDILTSATSLIGMNKKNAGGKIGDFAGSLGGAAAGAAIGSLIAPGIGTVIGGMIGSFAGSAAGKKLGESFQKQLPNIKESLNKSLNGGFKELDNKLDFSKGIDSATKKALSSYQKFSDQATKKLVEMGITHEAVTKDNVDKLISPYKKMVQKINSSFDETEKKTKDTLSKVPRLTKQEQDDILREVTQGSESKKKLVTQTEQQIEAIYNKAAKEHRTLTSDEKDKVAHLQDEMKNFAVQSMSTSASKQKIILGELKDHVGKITALQAAEVVKNSKKQEQQTIKSADNTYKQSKSAAQKKYDSVVAWANNEYYAQGNITKAQYDKLVGNARRERDDTVSAAKAKRDGAVDQAKGMHNDVVREAKLQAQGYTNQIDWETGTSLTKWDNFKLKLASVVNDITSGINKVLSFLHIPTIPTWTPKGSKSGISKRNDGFQAPIRGGALSSNAKGTNYFHGGQTLVGEEGFELGYHPQKGYAQILGAKGAQIVNAERGLRILNHRDSKKVINGGLGIGKVMPGYASGNSDIGDFAKWLTNPFDSIKSLFSKDLGSFDIGGIGKGILTYMQNNVGNFIKDKIGGMFNIGSANVSGNVAQWIRAGMAIAGVSGDQWFNGLSTIAMKESGGNPSIVNTWDSNAKAGHPSAGLMQMIRTTFMAHAKPGFTDWMNPIHQVVADIGYIMSRYGSIFNVPGLRALANGKRYVGYATGTKYHKGGPAVLGDGGQQEPYLTPQGQFGISPNVPTLFKNLPAGTKVWASIKQFKEQVGHYAAGTVVPMHGAAIEALLKITRSTKSADTSNKNNNDYSKVLLLLQQQNQLLFKMLQSLQGNGHNVSLQSLSDNLNKLNGSQYGVKSYMQGG
jgi:TP901 family phage tail tape measure protein